jgi:LPXTG-motif cell wall-anchored protein
MIAQFSGPVGGRPSHTLPEPAFLTLLGLGSLGLLGYGWKRRKQAVAPRE